MEEETEERRRGEERRRRRRRRGRSKKEKAEPSPGVRKKYQHVSKIARIATND